MDLLDSDTETMQDTCHDTCTEDKNKNQTPVQSFQRPKERRPEQNHIHLAVLSEGDSGSQAKTETLCPPRSRSEREGEESEREETESSDDNTTQYSIHPPLDCPYLLLLQGCSLAQVSHSNTRSQTDGWLSQLLPNHSLVTYNQVQWA